MANKLAGSKSEQDWEDFVALVGYSKEEVADWDEEYINGELANIKDWADRRKGGVKNYWKALRQAQVQVSPAAPGVVYVYSGGWRRDLTMECVEPNPGPKGMMKFFDEVANEFENVRVARDALANVELLIRNTTTSPGGLGYTDAHVKAFFETKTPVETKVLLQATADIADPLDSEVRSRLGLLQAQAPLAGPGTGKIALFKKLLQDRAINPQERVVAKAVEVFSNQLNILSEGDGFIAAKFYEKAKMYPPTSSRIALQAQGISVDGPFAPATRSELLWAFKNNTHPYVLKIPQEPSEARHELNVWQQLTNQALTHNLVGPIELQPFRSAAGNSLGVLVPVFATSLDRSPKPFQQESVLMIGQSIAKALRYMHSRGVFHCDVKAGNIFLDSQGFAHLGDYGSCVIGGGFPHEVSHLTHWPADLPFQATVMTPALDFLLLTVTLLDLLGVITLDASTGALTCKEIQIKVLNLEASGCKAFLVALNNYTE